MNEDDLANIASRPSELYVNIPTWCAHHSLITRLARQTRVRTPPLIAAPAHQWQTLLTVLLLAQRITAKVIGPDRKTVVSLDMSLYKTAKQLQMAQDDMDHLILCPGELHIVMAQYVPLEPTSRTVVLAAVGLK